MFKILRKFIHKTHHYFIWLWKQDGTPAERARGFALGVFSGCFPLFGLQIALGIILSTLFKGNRLLAIAGTWISNPMTYMPLYWFNYYVGSSLLGKLPNNESFIRITFLGLLDKGWFFLLRIFLGSIVVGTILSLIVGIFIYILLKSRRISSG